MAPKIFITGTTGYIAGDCLYAISNAHPDYELSALIRTQDKADVVKKAYPSIRIVLGGLDDSELLKKEAAQADIVLHAADASDHEGAAKSIIDGLVSGHSKETPGFYLHTGGAGILTYKDSENGCRGQWSDEEYDDWDKVDELTNLPDRAFHRNVDKLVLEAAQKYGDVLKVALICPPTIYGTGRGPVSGRSRQVYELTKLILASQYIPIVGEGKARWNNIHVADLANVYLLLCEAAVSQRLDADMWGGNVYYLVERDEHLWSDIAVQIGQEAEKKGYAKGLEKKTLSREVALEQAGFEAESWGMNSRGKALRARKVLDWKPSAPSLEDSIPEIVESEYQRLQKSKQ